jgi:YD repeat-containing protein
MAQSCPSNNCPGIIPLIAFGDLDIGCESVFSTQYSQCLSGVGGAVIGGTACCAAQFDTNLCACPPANYAAPPGPKVGGGPTCGEPVDAGTGLFTYNHTDLKLSDTIPILLTRSYRELDTVSRAFGVGMTHNYDLILVLDPSGENAYIDLILPDRAVVHYPRISPGTDIPTAVFEHTSSPSIYFGSTIKWNTDGWTLTLKNGTQMVFWLSRLVSITDRNSNTVQLQLDSDFNVTQITSPNGRWISLAYDSNDRVERAQDNTGRTTYYVYSSSGHLTKAYDAAGHATLYSYDSAGLMQSFTTPNGNVHVTNQYDSNSRVVKQTQADGGVFNFTYSLDGNGNVTETDMVDPRGYTCQMAFNSNGYLTSDVEAVGEPEQQETTYVWDTSHNLVDSSTDALGRTTAYTYDSLANVTGVTLASANSQIAAVSFTYDPNYNQLTSVTDPLGHTWTLTLDGAGNVTQVTDPNPLSADQLTATYRGQGQLASLTDGCWRLVAV